jgi:hypothetical protein
MEVSAKADINVTDSFNMLAKDIKKQIDYEIEHPDSQKLNVIINKKKNTDKQSCCK